MPTKIEWCEESWNPVTGCTPISEGCQNCYAKKMAQRLKGRFGYPADDPFRVTFHPNKLEQPLKWKKPRMIFVCSMGDLFHEDVKWSLVTKIHETMWRCPEHIFMILTKRPSNMLRYYLMGQAGSYDFPSHIWLGITAENQQCADERIPILLQIPAAKRFVSIEPMLGPMDLSRWMPPKHSKRDNVEKTVHHDYRDRLDWVICGGESGPGARPMHPDWPRSIRDQCQEAGVPFFFKQHGEYVWEGDCDTKNYEKYPTYHFGDDERGGIFSIKVGKKRAGRLLDGREWSEYPT